MYHEEFLITKPKNNKNDFISHATYFNFSTIYKMPQDQFLKFFKKHSVIENKSYYSLNDSQIYQLSKKMYKEFSKPNPCFRMIEVSYDDKKDDVSFKGLFVSEQYLKTYTSHQDNIVKKYQDLGFSFKPKEINSQISFIKGMLSQILLEYDYDYD